MISGDRHCYGQTMNAIQMSAARKPDGRGKARASEVRKLEGLKNISWLTARQLDKLAGALSVNGVERHTQIFDESDTSDNVYVLLSGEARVTCCDCKGRRAALITLAPGMIPPFPLPVVGIKYDFRCEAVTNCNVGRLGWDEFIEICLGKGSVEFKQIAANYVGRWDLVQLRCANFTGFTSAERQALTLLELCDNFGVRTSRGFAGTAYIASPG
jgi:hypothetical protein